MNTEIMIGIWLARIACGIVIGFAAGNIGRTPWRWFAWSVLAGPVIGLISLAIAFWFFPVKKKAVDLHDA